MPLPTSVTFGLLFIVQELRLHKTYLKGSYIAGVVNVTESRNIIQHCSDVNDLLPSLSATYEHSNNNSNSTASQAQTDHLRTEHIDKLLCSCDLELDPMTLVYKLDLDIPKMYTCTENKHARSRHSKFQARTVYFLV